MRAAVFTPGPHGAGGPRPRSGRPYGPLCGRTEQRQRSRRHRHRHRHGHGHHHRHRAHEKKTERLNGKKELMQTTNTAQWFSNLHVEGNGNLFVSLTTSIRFAVLGLIRNDFAMQGATGFFRFHNFCDLLPLLWKCKHNIDNWMRGRSAWRRMSAERCMTHAYECLQKKEYGCTWMHTGDQVLSTKY